MNDWISTQTWNLQDALEHVFLCGILDPKHQDYEEFIDFSTNYIKGATFAKRPSITITTAQKREIDQAERFLKNALPNKNVDIDMCPIVWIKLGIHYLADNSNRYGLVFDPFFKQRLEEKFHLKDLYFFRNCDATEISSNNISEIFTKQMLMPLDAFLLTPLANIITYATEWKIIIRKSISLKFEEIGSSANPKKTKRERLGKKYYDRTIKRIEEILSNTTHRKISKGRVTPDNRYTFNGSRTELLNILRKKNHDAFQRTDDYRAIDVISDIVDCRLK